MSEPDEGMEIRDPLEPDENIVTAECSACHALIGWDDRDASPPMCLECHVATLRTRLAAAEEDKGTAIDMLNRTMVERDAARRALERLVAELSRVQIEAVREGCGNTNAACLSQRVDEARALLAPERPRGGGKG